MKTSVMMRCPKCEKTSELDNLHLLDRSFKREWVDLTDEEIDNINYTSAHMLAREVLAKFKEKNGA